MSGLMQDPENPSQWIVTDATDWAYGIHQGATVIKNVHPPDRCLNEHCVVHNPSEHHMKDWRLTWRDDKATFERLCPHGVGHPDPDDAAFLVKVGRGDWTIHGCDGCCRPSEAS